MYLPVLKLLVSMTYRFKYYCDQNPKSLSRTSKITKTNNNSLFKLR